MAAALPGFAGGCPRIVRALANNMLTMDEPDHTRLRGIVDEAFRRHAILDMEPRILAIADRLAADLFADGSPADLVDRYARRLPLSVICELLGLPAADREKFMAWAATAVRVKGAISFFRMMRSFSAMRRSRSVRLFQRLTHRRRQGLGVNRLIVVEAAAEAKRHTGQQRACDELTCIIHDVKSPVFELGD